MNVLVTAGNTQVSLDRVRVLTNIFTGRTGAGLAVCAQERGHSVTLLTSHPEAVTETPTLRWRMLLYRTFDELRELLRQSVCEGAFDAVIHSAAVGDYQAAGVFAPTPATRFDARLRTWTNEQRETPAMTDESADKIKSNHDELWLRLVRAPKLIDQMRQPWGFRGILVKFKLEVGVADEELLKVAEASRCHSAADLMVANTLEGASAWAYLGPLAGRYERVNRRQLPIRLLEEIERLHEERAHG
jgi:phosphopantothenoylcysteine synthetase/decarboxylase